MRGLTHRAAFLRMPPGKEVVLICEMGGSLENKPGTQFGFQSRALKAAYYLKKAGYNKVCKSGAQVFQLGRTNHVCTS